MTLAEQVLELARWAPSGDNSQPWRFKLRAPQEFDVYGYDTRSHCVYDLDGWASQLAHGILLETISIAATCYGCRAHVEMPAETDGPRLRYRISLETQASVTRDPAADAIAHRIVQRRPMKPRALTSAERATLEQAAQPLRVRWFDSWPERIRLASLYARNARIRLTIPEAYAVHDAVIAWRQTTSEDRLPDASLGADPLLLSIMRYAMASFERLDRLNRLTGTLLPRLLLDFLPGILCSAQVALVAERPPDALANRIEAGRATRRFWLTATMLGLQMQPQYTPLVFARYARANRDFTRIEKARQAAGTVANGLDEALGADARSAVWLARIGPARAVLGRSLRRPLHDLIVTDAPRALEALRPLRSGRRSPADH